MEEYDIAWPARARKSSEAEVNISCDVIRPITSLQVWLRTASRPQCSVARIWARTPGGTGSGVSLMLHGSPGPQGRQPGSAPVQT